MYTFVFIQTSSSEQALHLCVASLARVSANLPPLGSPPRIESFSFPELGAAFATLKPEVDFTPSLIQHEDCGELVVITWGVQAGTADVAAAVRHTYQRLGIDGVSKMDGNLSAVVMDRAQRSVWLVGTLLGHRSLFYHSAPGTLMVSPHDLTLIATQRIPIVFDPVSLASMAACDWSLGGRSLIAGLARCHPLHAVRWRGGELMQRRLANPFERGRIAARDKVGVQRQVNRVVDRLMEYVERHVAGLPRVQCSLTAGVDSRAMFAALCGARGGGAITATTSGGERNLDVVVARRIARMAGAVHQRQEPTPPSGDDFIASARLRAFFCCGDTNAKRAMTRLPRIDPAREWSAGGNGGEIFRGFFYQYFGVTGEAPKTTPQLAERLLTWRFRRASRLPFVDPSIGAGVRERLLDVLAFAEGCSNDPYDMADLLYLFERYGRWGSAPAALPWQRGWTPFESIAAISEAFCLPSPLGGRCNIHALLVRRFLPARAYWIPINGGRLLAFEGSGRTLFALRQALTGGSMLVQGVRRRFFAQERRGDDMKADFSSGPLAGLIRDVLLEEGSLSQMLFGRGGVRQLLDGTQREGLAVIGVLITAELWRQLAVTLSQAPHP